MSAPPTEAAAPFKALHEGGEDYEISGKKKKAG